MAPKVTVLIRMYNSQETIERAVDSAINQTINRNDYSILIVDDGSKDNSLDIVSKYNDVQTVETNHQGSLAALNFGIQKVETPYVIYLDSDDWFEPSILETMYNRFISKPTTDFVYSDYHEIINNSTIVVSTKDNIFNTLAAGIMFSVASLTSVGLYDESLIFPEYDLLMKLLPSSEHHHISQPLYNYYRHSSSISADKSLVKQGLNQLFKKYGKQLPIRDY
jgi:glycosyltransferase involved in cell wall biosynthesis